MDAKNCKNFKCKYCDTNAERVAAEHNSNTDTICEECTNYTPCYKFIPKDSWVNDWVYWIGALDHNFTLWYIGRVYYDSGDFIKIQNLDGFKTNEQEKKNWKRFKIPGGLIEFEDVKRKPFDFGGYKPKLIGRGSLTDTKILKSEE